jgi:hypothetical protein
MDYNLIQQADNANRDRYYIKNIATADEPLQYKIKNMANILGISMSSVNLFKIYRTSDAVKEREADLINVDKSLGEFNEYTKGSTFNSTIMDRWVELSQINNPDNSILLEIVFVNISKPSKMIMTDILGLEGTTLKERITSGDYNVNIQGSFFTRNSFTRPYDQLDTLLSIINNKDNLGVFNINSPYLSHVCNHTGNDKGYNTLVLTDMVFNEPTDFKNCITFNLTCVTDINIPVVTLSQEDQK